MMSATEEYESSLLFGQKVVPSSSLYAGVSWHKVSKRWAVQIRHDGKRHHVGYFDSEESAARAYDEIAIRLRGPGVKTNFPQPLTSSSASVASQEAALTMGQQSDPPSRRPSEDFPEPKMGMPPPPRKLTMDRQDSGLVSSGDGGGGEGEGGEGGGGIRRRSLRARRPSIALSSQTGGDEEREENKEDGGGSGSGSGPPLKRRFKGHSGIPSQGSLPLPPISTFPPQRNFLQLQLQHHQQWQQQQQQVQAQQQPQQRFYQHPSQPAFHPGYNPHPPPYHYQQQQAGGKRPFLPFSSSSAAGAGAAARPLFSPTRFPTSRPPPSRLPCPSPTQESLALALAFVKSSRVSGGGAAEREEKEGGGEEEDEEEEEEGEGEEGEGGGLDSLDSREAEHVLVRLRAVAKKSPPANPWQHHQQQEQQQHRQQEMQDLPLPPVLRDYTGVCFHHHTPAAPPPPPSHYPASASASASASSSSSLQQQEKQVLPLPLPLPLESASNFPSQVSFTEGGGGVRRESECSKEGQGGEIITPDVLEEGAGGGGEEGTKVLPPPPSLPL